MILFALLQRLFALASLAILGTGGWLLWSWWEGERLADRLDLPEPGDERLYWALALLAFSMFGRFVILALLGRPGDRIDEGTTPGTHVIAPEGTRLHLRTSGRTDGPILLFTHGWGMSSRIWGAAERGLGRDFGIALWDLPGAGRSRRLKGRWSLEAFADALCAVLDALPRDRPVILLGHSIGGMTVQTLCLRHADRLNGRVAGIVLLNTTHRDPLQTMLFSGLFTALEPLIRVAMRIDVFLSPLLWLMNWQSYLSGSTHLAMRIAGYGERPSWSALDLSALLPTRTSPAVQARGNLAMMAWSVTERLPDIGIPALVEVGGRDVVTKDHAGETIAGALPDAGLIRLPKAGHMAPFERPERVHKIIADFARSATRQGRYGGATVLNHPRVVQS
jgi:pimeloyl-ACP methyl ester carboxylesterase